MAFIDVILLLINSGEIWKIAGLSIFISVTAVLISILIGIPVGVYLGLKRGKNSMLITAFLNTAMGLPPVLVGLVVYLMISRNGPLGSLQILFTPIAMIIAQAILTMPIIIGVTRSSIRALPSDFSETVLSFGATKRQQFFITIDESRYDIMIAIILAFGRAVSEVGAILIVGGNIRFHTRVLTTAIITEISKGRNDFALALGIILLSISYSVTLLMTRIQLKTTLE